MKINSNSFLNEWYASLKPTERQVLENIVKLKRINIQSPNLTHSVPRKILKIKRNTNNSA